MKTVKASKLINAMLSDEQVATLREMIVGTVASDSTSITLGLLLADEVIENTQKALMQNAVYAKAVKNSKPLKKSTKKHARK